MRGAPDETTLARSTVRLSNPALAEGKKQEGHRLEGRVDVWAIRDKDRECVLCCVVWWAGRHLSTQSSPVNQQYVS